MAVIVTLKDLGLARVEAGTWSSDVPELAEVVTRAIDPTIQGSDPDPDLTLARRAVRRFGGRVLQERTAWHPDPPAVA